MFALDVRREDGSTLREHLEAVEKQTGKTPERLAVEPIPQEYLWHWNQWVSLASGRTQTGMGPAPLSWLDMEAWSRLMCVKLSPLDVTIIRTIDTAWFVAQATERERQSKVAEAKKSNPEGRTRRR